MPIGTRDPRTGRIAPKLTEPEVRDARRRIRAGETLRAVARDLDVAHSTLARRFRISDARATADDALRAEARAIRRLTPEVQTGDRPEARPGRGRDTSVHLLSDLDREIQRATAALEDRNARRAAERARDEAEELSNDEYMEQRREAFEVQTGRKSAVEVREARRLGRAPRTRESMRSRFDAERSQGLMYSNRELLANATTGRPL